MTGYGSQDEIKNEHIYEEKQRHVQAYDAKGPNLAFYSLNKNFTYTQSRKKMHVKCLRQRPGRRRKTGIIQNVKKTNKLPNSDR